MRVFRKVSGYFFEIVFNAPKSHFVVLNVFYLVSVGIYALFFFEDNGEILAGLEFLAFFIFLFFLDITLLLLLIWRRFFRKSYKLIMKPLSSTIIVLLLILPLFYGAINYNFDIQYENNKRQEYIQSNVDYFAEPDKTIDTSVPLSLIKTKDQIKKDALNHAIETALVILFTPFAIIAPLAVIKEVDYRYFKNKN